MAVSIDTQNSVLNAGGSTASVTLTVANNANRVLVILTSMFGIAKTVSSVAYTSGSGGTWAKLGAMAGSSEGELEIWSSIAPSTGSVTVLVTFSTTDIDAGAALYSLYGVDQTTPVNGYGSTDASASQNITVSTGSMALARLCSGGNPDPIISGTNDLSDANNDVYRAAHASNGVFAWTSASPRAINGCNVVAAAAGGSIFGSNFYRQVAGLGGNF